MGLLSLEWDGPEGGDHSHGGLLTPTGALATEYAER